MTVADVWIACMRNIVCREPEIRAWVEAQPPKEVFRGPLYGIPFGAKDIFETAGLATEYGSPLYEGRKGDFDADIIVNLKRSGAVLIGKTRTAAFASFDPAATTNPRLPGHTPGGSSSGSAAAVASGMVPFAVGSQTLGSVLRPASYCGVCGFKPTFGLLSTEGMLPFAPSLDTAGLFTATAADMAALWERGFGGGKGTELQRAARLHLPCEEDMECALDRAVDCLLEQGVLVDEYDPPEGWEELLAAARTINTYEGARTHRERFQQFGGRIGARLGELVSHGLAMERDDYESAKAQVASMRVAMQDFFRQYPAILTPAAMGAAPKGLASTGDPAHNAPWTALGTPSISVPLPVNGGPLGMQIAAAWGRDDALIGMAADAERRLGIRQYTIGS